MQYSYEQLRSMIHDSYVLNYIMQKLSFWKMRIYEPKHKFNMFKIKLYRSVRISQFSLSELKKSSLMLFDNKGKPHVYVSNDASYHNVVNNEIKFFYQTCDLNEIVAKSKFLDIIKKHQTFKWKDIEFFTSNSEYQNLDELLVNADIEQNEVECENENTALRIIERTIDILF